MARSILRGYLLSGQKRSIMALASARRAFVEKANAMALRMAIVHCKHVQRSCADMVISEFRCVRVLTAGATAKEAGPSPRKRRLWLRASERFYDRNRDC